MADPIDVVERFFGMLSDEATHHEAYRTFFRPDTVWENHGMITTIGTEGALAFFNRNPQTPATKTEMRHITAKGNLVFTEREDRCFRAGKLISTMGVMGIFEVEDDKIVAWRDYFDTRRVGAELAAGGVPE